MKIEHDSTIKRVRVIASCSSRTTPDSGPEAEIAPDVQSTRTPDVAADPDRDRIVPFVRSVSKSF